MGIIKESEKIDDSISEGYDLIMVSNLIVRSFQAPQWEKSGIRKGY